MASTLVTRICDDELLTPEESAAVAAELGKGEEESLKLAIAPLLGVAGEIIAQRMPASAMLSWLTQGEYTDALVLLSSVENGMFTLNEVFRILGLGEFAIYTPSQIELIFGL